MIKECTNKFIPKMKMYSIIGNNLSLRLDIRGVQQRNALSPFLLSSMGRSGLISLFKFS